MGLKVQPKSRERVARKRDVVLPQGLIGFEDVKRFRILERTGREEGAYLWLEARDRRDLRFLALLPARLPAMGFEPDIPAQDLEWLGCARSREDLELLVLAARRGKRIFANLRAPLVFNIKSGVGKQVILEGEEYSTEAPVALPERRSAAAV